MPAEVAEFTTYYLETNNSLLRVNIPKTWHLEIERSAYSGMNAACFMDENGIVKAAFDNIINVRDSSLPMQVLRAQHNQEGEMLGVVWDDIREETPLNTQIIATLTQNARRRTRNNTFTNLLYNNNDYVSAPYYVEDELDEGE